MIALLGYGFVGKAYYNAFNLYHEITIVDPNFNNIRVEDVKNLHAAIVCVPTPSTDDGSCDMSIVHHVISTLPKHIPILIKSTISLDGWKDIERDFPEHSVTFSPEFLRASAANEDLRNLKHIFLAGGNTDFWRDFYSYTYPEIKVSLCTPQDAIAIKYFRNAFLATKCSFFNEMYDFCETMGLNYDCVRWGVGVDSRIGESHTFIEKETRGWGGMCLPKDTQALLKTAANANINLNTLEAAVNSNNSIRKKC